MGDMTYAIAMPSAAAASTSSQLLSFLGSYSLLFGHNGPLSCCGPAGLLHYRSLQVLLLRPSRYPIHERRDSTNTIFWLQLIQPSKSIVYTVYIQ